MNKRRAFILGGGATVAMIAAGGITLRLARPAAEETDFEVALTEAEWRAQLTPEEFAVLRQSETEAPGSSPLDAEYRPGTYTCAGCGNPVYEGATKFDSLTGWPSFTEAIAGGVGTRPDYKLVFARTEAYCARCGGHLGHVFDDGPEPTGKRHCINGVALDFQPDTA